MGLTGEFGGFDENFSDGGVMGIAIGVKGKGSTFYGYGMSSMWRYDHWLGGRC
jgi:hypothetical protein